MRKPGYRHQLRKLYHGAVLGEIARQCPLVNPETGKPFPKDVAIAAWKEHFRKLHHPGRSTEEMDDGEFYAQILRAEAHAASRLGVEFPVREHA